MTKVRRPVANREEIESYIAQQPPAELNMAKSIVRRLVVVGPLMIGTFGITKGGAGAAAAAVGVTIVALYYLGTGWLLSTTARVSLATYYAGALFGFLVRLALIGVTMVVLADRFGMDRVALGVTVAVSYLALLMWEAARFGKDKTKRASAEREDSVRQRMGDKTGV